MNNIGFIKRIDDLGRIVIPKDLRKKLDIESNENMEISLCNDEIVIKKYSILDDNEKLFMKIGSVLNEILSKQIIITNRDRIIYSNIRELNNKEISPDLKNIIVNRIEYNKYSEIYITNEYKICSNVLSKLIIIDSDSSGLIMIIDNSICDRDKLVLNIVMRLVQAF